MVILEEYYEIMNGSPPNRDFNTDADFLRTHTELLIYI